MRAGGAMLGAPSEVSRRAMLLSAYAAVEAAVASAKDSREVAAFFAAHAVLWGGDAAGFATAAGCLVGAPATALALGRPDPLPIFPELAHLLTSDARQRG